MGPGRVSTITVFFFNKHEGGKCNMQEEHEPNQNSEKKKRIETKKIVRMKITLQIMLTRIVSSEFQDQHKKCVRTVGFFYDNNVIVF